MQEEVEQRIVSLMISCGKLGEQEFRKAVAKLLEQLKSDHQKHQYSKANPHGKMTVKQLAAKDKGLQSIEVTDQNMSQRKGLCRLRLLWTRLCSTLWWIISSMSVSPTALSWTTTPHRKTRDCTLAWIGSKDF